MNDLRIPGSEDLTVYDIAEAIGVDTKTFQFGLPDTQIIYKRIMDKLKEVPYCPFPIAFHTVDIAVVRVVKGEFEILLGRKPYRTQFQLFGGFVDPGESAEHAALRELKEESTIDLFEVLTMADVRQLYLGSFFINDSRYIDSCHKVSTSLYMIGVEEDIEHNGADDIAETNWFKFKDLLFDNSCIHEIHRDLLETVITKLCLKR